MMAGQEMELDLLEEYTCVSCFIDFRNLYIIKAFDQAPFSTFIMLLIINLDLVLGFPGVHPDGEGGAGG